MVKTPKFLKSILSKITDFDMFGKSVDILIDGNEQNKTLLGAMVSIACLSLSIIFTVPTFKNFIYQTNPTIVYTLDYDTTNINMDYNNFYFSVGFFHPLQGAKLAVSNSSNNYTALLNITDIKINCNTCNFNISSNYYEEIYKPIRDKQLLKNRNLQESTSSEYNFTQISNWKKEYSYIAAESVPDYTNKNISNNKFFLMYCNTSMFDNIRIKSLAKPRADDISAIMSTYSFCLPKNFKGDINDGSSSEYDESMSVNLEYKETTEVPSNLKSMFTSSGAVDPNTGKPPIPLYEIRKYEITQQDKPPLPPPEENTLSNPDSNNNLPPPPDSTKEGQTQPPPPDSTKEGQTQPPPPDSTKEGQTQPPPPDSTKEGQTQPPPSDTTKEGQTQPPPSDTTNNTAPKTETTTIDGQTPPPPPPNRILNLNYKLNTYNNNSNNNVKFSSNNRELQLTTTDTSTNTNNPNAKPPPVNNIDYSKFITKDNLSDQVRKLGDKNYWPKLIVLTKNIQITPNNSTIISPIYDMNLLDYYDLSGVPYSYDIYIQNITVTVNHQKFYEPILTTYTYLIAKVVEVNKLDRSQKSSVNFNFKVYSDTQLIDVKYTTFDDVLAMFGSFFSVFSLGCTILSGVYNDYFFKEELINSIFKFTKYNKSRNSLIDFPFNNKQVIELKQSTDKSDNIKNFKNNLLITDPINKNTSNRPLNKDSSNTLQQELYFNLNAKSSLTANNFRKSPNIVGYPKIDEKSNKNSVKGSNAVSNNQIKNISNVESVKIHNNDENSNNNIITSFINNKNNNILTNKVDNKNNNFADFKSSVKSSNSNFYKPGININTKSNAESDNKSEYSSVCKLKLLSENINNKAEKVDNESRKSDIISLVEDKSLKNKKLDKVNAYQIFSYSICLKWCINTKRKKLFERAYSIIENSLDIKTIIKKQFEVTFLKHALLKTSERQAFPLFIEDINIDEIEKAYNYLEECEDDEFDTEKLNDINVDEILSKLNSYNDKNDYMINKLMLYKNGGSLDYNKND